MIRNILAAIGVAMLIALAVLASPVLGLPPPPYAAFLPPVPGALNPAVTQANIKTTICRSGWTRTIRPSASYTTKLKQYQMAQWHITGAASAVEEDHRVPLGVGGNPTSPRNLWPQPWAGPFGAHRKDILEIKIRRLVCSGAMTLRQGQAVFLSDWVKSYQTRIGK